MKVTEVELFSVFFVFNFEGGCGWLWFLTPGSQPPILKNGGNSFWMVFEPIEKTPLQRMVKLVNQARNKFLLNLLNFEGGWLVCLFFFQE